jgi:hypothetical protein
MHIKRETAIDDREWFEISYDQDKERYKQTSTTTEQTQVTQNATAPTVYTDGNSILLPTFR